MIKVYGDSTPSLLFIKKRIAGCKRGRTSISDEDHPGYPNRVTILKINKKNRDIVINDREVKVLEITDY